MDRLFGFVFFVDFDGEVCMVLLCVVVFTSFLPFEKDVTGEAVQFLQFLSLPPFLDCRFVDLLMYAYDKQ